MSERLRVAERCMSEVPEAVPKILVHFEPRSFCILIQDVVDTFDHGRASRKCSTILLFVRARDAVDCLGYRPSNSAHFNSFESAVGSTKAKTFFYKPLAGV